MKMNKKNINQDCYFFWGGICSNWFPANFKYKEKKFSNSEQAFMWEKAKFFGDEEIADVMLITPDPAEVKSLGRKVKNFDVEKWSIASYRIMLDVNLAKFKQNPMLKDILLNTGDLMLVEASPYDKIWGIGLNVNDAEITPKEEWKGTNWLGKALMEVREYFLSEYNRL